MAIIATLFGGIIGFISFLTALLAFDTTFLAACGIYIASGLIATTCMIAFAMIPMREEDPEQQTALSA
ncbi:MAG: hypothetical protein WA790_15165 [Sulfitobacter sp.]